MMGAESDSDLRTRTWQRLLQEVGWRPPHPGPGPSGAARFWLTCCPGQGERLHPVEITADWVLHVPHDELTVSEHVAETLQGGHPRCQQLQQCLPELRALVLHLHRVTAPTWDALEYGRLSLPRWPRADRGPDWSRGVRVSSSSMATTVATRQWFGAAPSANTRAAWEDPRILPDLAAAGRVIQGGRPAAQLLWLHGLHPDLVVAIHDRLAIPGALPALAYAAAALWRTNMETGEKYSPMPVGWIGAAARESGFANLEGAVASIAALAVPTDAGDPSQLLQWLHDPLSQATHRWPQLHASGVTVPDVRRWLNRLPGVHPPTFTDWLSHCPPAPEPSERPPVDFLTWVAEEALGRAAHRVAEYRPEVDPSGWGLSEQEEQECMTHAPASLEALPSGDRERIAEVLVLVERLHTDSGALKSYRYHLDACPVADAARVVNAIRAYDQSPASAWEALGPRRTGLLSEVDSEAGLRPSASPLRLSTWVALELRAGRLADTAVLDALRHTATDDPPGDPGWLMREILRSMSG